MAYLFLKRWTIIAPSGAMSVGHRLDPISGSTGVVSVVVNLAHHRDEDRANRAAVLAVLVPRARHDHRGPRKISGSCTGFIGIDELARYRSIAGKLSVDNRSSEAWSCNCCT